MFQRIIRFMFDSPELESSRDFHDPNNQPLFLLSLKRAMESPEFKMEIR